MREIILDTARRKLYEETGAVDFEIRSVCVCPVIAKDNFDGRKVLGCCIMPASDPLKGNYIVR